MTLFEANEAASVIQEVAGEEANIIFGTVIDESLVDEIQLTVIATGFYLNQGRFEPAAEETAGVRRLSARTREKARAAEARAPIAVGALEERSARRSRRRNRDLSASAGRSRLSGHSA